MERFQIQVSMKSQYKVQIVGIEMDILSSLQNLKIMK